MPRKTNKKEWALIGKIIKDQRVRRMVTRKSHLIFFYIYFAHYVQHPIAEFQNEIFRLTEDASIPLVCIVAFRGSGKSTLITLSYALWATLGVQQKKFVLIVCGTQGQAKNHMSNLKKEVESNKLLTKDLGPFHEENDEWARSSIVFSNTGARIMVASVEQSIRGVRHRQNRPDLIILDDVEDSGSTKTLEGRDKTFNWYTQEIVPLGDSRTRIIIVGNLLDDDSLVMRLKKRIDAEELDGIYRWFPLIDENGDCLWSEKFDSGEKIESLRRSLASDMAWQREYLLKIIGDEYQIVSPEWIVYYDFLPEVTSLLELTIVITGVDLAISQAKTADFTAMVTVNVYRDRNGNAKIYVLPNPINKRMTFYETISTARNIRDIHMSYNHVFVVENTGFQAAAIEALKKERIHAIPFIPRGDKSERLALAAAAIQRGQVLFPRKGTELLLTQLTRFGRELHDDLADSFTMAVLHAVRYQSKISDTPIFGSNKGPKPITAGLWNMKF